MGSIAGCKVIVVGAGGFLGRACVAALGQAGAHVVGVDRVDAPATGAAEWLVADVLTDGVPAAALDGADTLVNLAWANDPGRGNADMRHDVATNVACSVRVFEQAAQAGLRRLVYASSGGTIYGKTDIIPTPEQVPIGPINGYGAGKAAAELYLGAMHHAYGIEVCTLRVANPYGPGQYPNRGQGFIATAIARTIRREPIEIFGSAELGRDYLYIDDVARAFALACADGGGQRVFNVGSGRDHSLAELIPLIFAAVGHATEVRHGPKRPVDVPRMALDVTRIGDVLGWRPEITIADGLARTVAWIRALLDAPA